MPEGPEVEVVRSGLVEILGKQILEFTVAKHKKYVNLSNYCSNLQNSIVTDIQRKGKFLIWIFDVDQNSQYFGLNHLGMTGVWYLYSNDKWKREKISLENFKHFKLYMKLEGGLHLIFSDPRTFGRFEIFEDDSIYKIPQIKKLGPDILDPKFDVEEFEKRVQGRNKTKTLEIGKALLDPKIVSGCGNIYKNEALFLAKINPYQSVKDLNSKNINDLANGLMEVAQKALENKGTTLRDYSHVDGYSGLMQNHLLVYGRDSEPCVVCKNFIESSKQGDRTSFWCNYCQPLLS